MAEDLCISKGSKMDKYRTLLPQIKSLIEGEEDLIANLANVSAALKESCVGPFQGPVACTRIAKGRGVCGTAWAEAKTIVVPDVDAFPGHIACSSLSRSEIVVPLVREAGEVWGVLDIDSDSLDAFDGTDERFLEEICSWFRVVPCGAMTGLASGKKAVSGLEE